jgi:hypothetical protein
LSVSHLNTGRKLAQPWVKRVLTDTQDPHCNTSSMSADQAGCPCLSVIQAINASELVKMRVTSQPGSRSAVFKTPTAPQLRRVPVPSSSNVHRVSSRCHSSADAAEASTSGEHRQDRQHKQHPSLSPTPIQPQPSSCDHPKHNSGLFVAMFHAVSVTEALCKHVECVCLLCRASC